VKLEQILVCALAASFLVIPGAYALRRSFSGPRAESNPPVLDWSLTFSSTLAFVFAFNVMFFVQELFLVVPKALTPGLTPTLFHNNHDWRGLHPLVELLQGTGAVATVTAGMACGTWLRRWPPAGVVARLVLFWMALLGFLAALPQVVIGALIPQNDLGRAMAYLGLSPWAKLGAAVAACAAMSTVCRWLTPYLLSLTTGSDTAHDRARQAWRLGTLPALLSLPLIVPFRVPGAALEVLLPPGLDALIAAVWIAAVVWHAKPAAAEVARPQGAGGLVIALLALLAFFQLVLRPGIEFS
jgi:hypothetical protein